MHLYQLSSKSDDQAFLDHELVKCDAFLTKALLQSIQIGDKIVIQLSNRSKYMGTIRSISSGEGSAQNGFIIIQKA